MEPSRRVIVYAGALFALLILLVTLQVRWLAQLERAQHEEMRRNLQGGLERAAAALDEVYADVTATDAEARVPAEAIERELERALGSDALRTYVFAIDATDAMGDSGSSYYRSEEPMPAPERAPDASAPVFHEPSRWVGFFEGMDEASEPSEAELLLPVDPQPAPWRLVALHRGGSLAEVVARGKLQNLAIGGGVLVLLAAAVVALLVGEARARRLAEKELLFVASVSHELRTPLAVIRSAAANIKGGIVQDRTKLEEYGALIDREVERIGARVERVLRFSGDGNVARGAFEDLAVAELVDEALSGCDHWRDRRSFEIATELEDAPPTVRGDRAALVSALQNLLDNAIKYGPEGQTVRVRAFRTNGAHVAFEVADEGPGIPPADRQRVFEPFYRGRAAREGNETGSGLGLGVVAQIAGEHGGTVAIGDPSTLTLQLPLDPPASP